MRGREMLDTIENLNPAYIEDAAEMPMTKKTGWLKWAAMAACLCVILAVALPHFRRTPAEIPKTLDGDTECLPPNLTVDGTRYYISSWMTKENELPVGFSQAGICDVAGYEDRPYYTNPNIPEWIFIYYPVNMTGSPGSIEPRYVYWLFVEERLRGKDLICVDGEYYISLWSATSYGKHPDVSKEYYDIMKNLYGIRIEGEPPEDFVSQGVAEFSGHDTVPRGKLVSNLGAKQVYLNKKDPDVALVATQWSSVKGQHSGFDVYIRYDCPFAE